MVLRKIKPILYHVERTIKISQRFNGIPIVVSEITPNEIKTNNKSSAE